MSLWCRVSDRCFYGARCHPGQKLIVGGTAFSLFAKELMTLSKADFGLIGEGEIAFPKFLSAFPDLISDLPGLCYYENGRLRINHPRPMFDLKEYVSPDYSILPPDRYADINQYVPAIGVETRRGCPSEMCLLLLSNASRHKDPLPSGERYC